MELSKEYLHTKAVQEKRDGARLRTCPTPAPILQVDTPRTALATNPNPATQPTKTLKSVTIEGSFPELKGARMYQSGRGKGSNIKAAAAAAMRDLLKSKGLKAQRFTVCKATISFGTITEG
jgi:hypothetical protein